MSLNPEMDLNEQKTQHHTLLAHSRGGDCFFIFKQFRRCCCFFIKIISYFNFMTFLKKGKTYKNQPQILKNKIFFFAISVTFFILALPLCFCYFNVFFSFIYKTLPL